MRGERRPLRRREQQRRRARNLRRRGWWTFGRQRDAPRRPIPAPRPRVQRSGAHPVVTRDLLERLVGVLVFVADRRQFLRRLFRSHARSSSLRAQKSKRPQPRPAAFAASRVAGGWFAVDSVVERERFIAEQRLAGQGLCSYSFQQDSVSGAFGNKR